MFGAVVLETYWHQTLHIFNLIYYNNICLMPEKCQSNLKFLGSYLSTPGQPYHPGYYPVLESFPWVLNLLLDVLIKTSGKMLFLT